MVWFAEGAPLKPLLHGGQLGAGHGGGLGHGGGVGHISVVQGAHGSQGSGIGQLNVGHGGGVGQGGWVGQAGIAGQLTVGPTNNSLRT